MGFFDRKVSSVWVVLQTGVKADEKNNQNSGSTFLSLLDGKKYTCLSHNKKISLHTTTRSRSRAFS